MNEIDHKFLLAGDKFMPEVHLTRKKEFKCLKKQEIQNIFTEINQIILVYSMIWLMEI